MADELTFNGINGTTGEYWDGPKTVDEFYDHVMSNNMASGNRPDDIKELIDNPGVWKFFETIITTTEQCLQENTDDDRYDLWLDRLAKGIVEQFLNKKDEFEAILQLKERMRLNVSYILKFILEKLMKDDAYTSRELGVLFSEPDDQDIRKEKLKHDAVDKILGILGTLFSEESQQKALTNQDAFSLWVNDFFGELRTLPVKPLQAMGHVKQDSNLKYSFTQQWLTEDEALPLYKLVTKLKEIQTPKLELLIEQLDQFSSASWDDLLTILSDGLLLLPDVTHTTKILSALKEWVKALWGKIAHLGTIEGVDPTDISQAGWGIIFPVTYSQKKVNDISGKLRPLLNLRKKQAKWDTLYKEYSGNQGYRPDDTASRFITRHGARVTDPVDPSKVPYYLLIVGSPEAIPFHFQYQLEVQYAVGRIDFGEDYEAYANYARNVVAAEHGEVDQSKQAVFFGVANPGDKATEMSTTHLVQPLLTKFQDKTGPDKVLSGWEIRSLLSSDATKANLLQAMTEDNSAFIFTASHGLEFSPDSAKRQQERQGALLCQEWKSGDRGEIPANHYVCGADLTDSDLSGLIAFFFACYGAGTPRYDEYAKQGRERKAIAKNAFVAALPQAMLKQGALAVIGHVERAWATSFLDRRSEYVTVFESTIERLLKGYPVGWAMEYFNNSYAALSSELTMALSIPTSRNNKAEIAQAWIANNDARGYIVIGDPAVRLPVVKEHQKTKTYVIHGEKAEW